MVRTVKDPRDICQSPPEAVWLLGALNPRWVIWEPACGEGNLVRALRRQHQKVIATDILQGHDFLSWQPKQEWDAIVTNPPFTLKYLFLKRCIELHKPWALLMPFAVFGSKTFNSLTSGLDLKCFYPIKRIAYKMPFKGWDGSPTQATVWITSGFPAAAQRCIRMYMNPDWTQPKRKGQ